MKKMMKQCLKARLLFLHQKMMTNGMLLQASKIMHLLTTGKITLYLIGEEFDCEWELEKLGVTHFNFFHNTYSTSFIFNEEKYANIIKQNM